MKIDVKKVAKLANLPLTPSEEEKFSKQLEETLDFVKQLEEIETSDVEPTSQVTGLENIFREDEIGDCTLSQADALKNAKSIHNGFFKVKAILEVDNNES